MTRKISNIIVASVFALIIVGLSLALVISPKAAIIDSERRASATLPDLSWKNIRSGLVSDGMENYLADGFFARDVFRRIKARFQTGALFMKENNSIAEKNGYFTKIETKLNDASLKNAGEKLKKIYEKYVINAGGKCYVSIIPDKSYYFARDYGYPSYDFSEMTEKIASYLADAEYIDLTSLLSLDCYYKTDTHWRQEKIVGVAAEILKKTGRGEPLTSDEIEAVYKINALEGFSGVYAGQSAMDPSPETLYYLTSAALDGCRVYDYETMRFIPVYDTEKFDGGDGYDVFLSGTKPILKIENPAADTDAELIVFRDSFGSSIAPLLVGSYRRVTLIDIRYVSPEALGSYVSFGGADVLFLYSAAIMNNSFSFR